MKTNIDIVPLEPEHIKSLIDRNKDEKFSFMPEGISPADMAKACLLPGSVAYCLLADGVPVFASGIINTMWGRGDAWLLISPDFYRYRKTSMKAIRDILVREAEDKNFRRVQATSFIDNGHLFEFLGFDKEAVLKRYGPRGETGTIYARFFGKE